MCEERSMNVEIYKTLKKSGCFFVPRELYSQERHVPIHSKKNIYRRENKPGITNCELDDDDFCFAQNIRQYFFQQCVCETHIHSH